MTIDPNHVKYVLSAEMTDSRLIYSIERLDITNDRYVDCKTVEVYNSKNGSMFYVKQKLSGGKEKIRRTMCAYDINKIISPDWWSKRGEIHIGFFATYEEAETKLANLRKKTRGKSAKIVALRAASVKAKSDYDQAVINLRKILESND